MRWSAGPVCLTRSLDSTYAPITIADDALCNEAMPWSFEEPCLKRPRLVNFAESPSAIASVLSASVEGPKKRQSTWLDFLPPKRKCSGEGPLRRIFVWGPLPSLRTDVFVIDAGRGCVQNRQPSVDEDYFDDVDNVTRVDAIMGDQERFVHQTDQETPSAVMPYSIPISKIAAALLRGGTLCGFERFDQAQRTLDIPVRVAEVVVCPRGELLSITIHKSQAALAAQRLGRATCDFREFQDVGDGFVLVPVRNAFHKLVSRPAAPALNPQGPWV